MTTKINKTKFGSKANIPKRKEEPIRKYYGIANEKGMGNNELYAKFMVARFPERGEYTDSYDYEWADRFMSGNPTVYMDGKSKAIYMKLLKEQR